MQEEGFVAKLLYPEGASNVKLGEVVAIIVEKKEDVQKFKDYKVEGSAPVAPVAAAPKKEAAVEQAKPQASQSSAPTSGDRIFASPLAKKVAAEGGLNLSGVSGTGPNNRILKTDVEAALHAAQQAPATKKASIIIPEFSGQFQDTQVSNIRKIIAERLSYSKQNIPHYYVTVAVNVDQLIKLRGKLNAVAKSKISVNDMVIKAASLACVRVPESNSSWLGESIRKFKNVNMCVAVQTDFGLMAPVIQNTHLKGLEEIAAEVKAQVCEPLTLS